MQQYKRLPLSLPPDLYARLEKWAAAEDRDPVQQARKIVREALEALPSPKQQPKQQRAPLSSVVKPKSRTTSAKSSVAISSRNAKPKVSGLGCRTRLPCAR
jgi:hypothetical protein